MSVNPNSMPNGEIIVTKPVCEVLNIPESKQDRYAYVIAVAIDRLQHYFDATLSYASAFEKNYDKYLSGERGFYLVDITPDEDEIRLLYGTPASDIHVVDTNWLRTFADTATVGETIELLKNWVIQLGYNYEDLLAEHKENQADE